MSLFICLSDISLTIEAIAEACIEISALVGDYASGVGDQRLEFSVSAAGGELLLSSGNARTFAVLHSTRALDADRSQRRVDCAALWMPDLHRSLAVGVERICAFEHDVACLEVVDGIVDRLSFPPRAIHDHDVAWKLCLRKQE